MKRALIALTSIPLLSAVAFGQADFTANGQYPQYRGYSGLPGSGFGVLPDGTPSFNGAMTYSSPQAYSLNNWHFSIDAENASDYDFFRLPHVTGRRGNQDSNGKLGGMVGIPLGKFGAVTAGITILSSIWDTAFSFQYQLPFTYKGAAVSFGCQDFRGAIHGSGAENVPGGNGLSRSYYGVITAPLSGGIYASAGLGDRRFEKGFANISVPLGDRFKFVGEHDGFNFTEALAYHPNAPRNFMFFGKSAIATIMIGYEKSHYAFWSINVSF